VQFTKNDWRNRNIIKTPQGLKWISVPVGPSLRRLVREVELPDGKWPTKHWRTLENNYRRTACFDEIADIVEPIYRDMRHTMLSEFNRAFIQTICGYLGIRTKISSSSDYRLAGDRSERLLELCWQTGAKTYVSGPAAKTYLDVPLFRGNGIEVDWFEYSGYPKYPQLWGEFEHCVSILDLMFNCGRQSPDYMKFVDGGKR